MFRRETRNIREEVPETVRVFSASIVITVVTLFTLTAVLSMQRVFTFFDIKYFVRCLNCYLEIFD